MDESPGRKSTVEENDGLLKKLEVWTWLCQRHGTVCPRKNKGFPCQGLVGQWTRDTLQTKPEQGRACNCGTGCVKAGMKQMEGPSKGYSFCQCLYT